MPSLPKNLKCSRIAILILIASSIVSSLAISKHIANDIYKTQPTFVESKDRREKGAAFFVPAITIVKSAPVINGSDCGAIPFTYTITNESTNSESLINVVITDTDLGGVIAGPNASDFSGDVDDIGVLQPGETWTFNFNYPITQDDLENGSFGERPANVVADVQGQGIQVTDISHPSDASEDGPTIVDISNCQSSSIGLLKTSITVDLDSDTCFENIYYTLQVVNLGTLNLQNVVLTDNLLGGVVPGPIPGDDIGDDGILSPGETWEYQALYSADLLASGTIDNQAEVNSETLQGVPVSDLSDDDSFFEDETTPSPYDEVCTGSFARMGLIKEASPLDLNGDGCPETIEYTFTLQNVAQVDITDIVLTDELLGGEITNRTDNNQGDNILGADEVWTYQAQYSVTAVDLSNGAVTNQAVVTGRIPGFQFLLFDNSDNDNFNENDSTAEQMEGYCALPDIGLIKGPGSSDFLVDLDGDGCLESIHYEFTVANTGGIDLDRVILNDPLLGGDITGPVPSSDANSDGVLSVGESWTYEAFYPLTQADLDAGSVDNQASVTAMEVGTTNQHSDLSDNTNFEEDRPTTATTTGGSICVAEANIGLIKTVPLGNLLDLDSDGCPETLRYEFIVENTGAIDLEQIVVTDPNLNTSITGPATDIGNDNVLSIGEIWTFEADYPITAQNTTDGFVQNQAEVTAVDTFFGNTISDLSDHTDNDQDRETVTNFVGTVCFAAPEIGLIKAAPLGSLEDLDNDGCSENIRYTFTIRNTGAIPLEQIVLTDLLLGPNPIDGPLPGSDLNADSVLSPNETWTYQSLYPITEQDIQDTFVTNQANVMAFEQGTTNSVTDASDDNSFDENDETITSVVGACAAEARINITKNATPVDADGDGCPETIQYSFLVGNMGAIDLFQVVVDDPIISNAINGPLNGTDTSGDGILSTTETWLYEATYTITQTDFDEGAVTNQAQVSALEIISNNIVEGVSEQVITSFVDVCEEPVDPTDPTDPVEPIDSNFEIFNGITPNGDGINDFFEIRGIENYPNNLLQVFNRWGVLVYEAEGYGVGNSIFTGQSEGRATIAKERALPTGTYFYSLTFIGNNPGQEVYSGYMYISRD